MQAATVIFDTGVELRTCRDLIKRIPKMSHSTIYYHFIEARRRTPAKIDDFSTWLMGLEQKPEALIQVFSHLDFYFLRLHELKTELIGVTNLKGI